jgi:hypothetical protein
MSFPELPLPPEPRATGTLVPLARWASKLLAAVRHLDDRTRALYPQPSPTVLPTITDSGTTYAASQTARKRTAQPWRATNNGNEYITVAEGSIFFPSAQGALDEDMAPIAYIPLTYAGGSIEITATGWLYALAIYEDPPTPTPVSEVVLTDETLQLWSRIPSLVDVAFSADVPGTYSPPAGTVAYYPIASVILADTVARVDRQYLTHNPTHDLVTINLAV